LKYTFRRWDARTSLAIGVALILLVVGLAPNLTAFQPRPGVIGSPERGSSGPAIAASHVGPIATCLPMACSTGPRSSAPLVPHAGLGSTATNWYVANWAGEGMIRENPNDPRNLVAGGLYQAPSAANDTGTYNTSGVSGVFTSRDGGRTWFDQTLPPSPDWSDATSAECGHIHLADTAIGFGPNDVVYYIDLSYPIASSTTCPNPQAGIGLYGAVSHDGGTTWNAPVALRGTVAGTSVDKPWIAVDPNTGEAYVAYTDDNNGSGIWIQNSTDEGASWSDALELTSGGRTGLGVELMVDPSGGVDAAWIDSGGGQVLFTRSTDHGATFSTPVVIGTPVTTYSSPYPDAFRTFTLPALGVDGFPGNPYTGTLYSVWQDGLGGAAGDPTVKLSRSTNNGSTWSTPIRVSSNTTDEDFQPSVAVGPDGAVYVDWYGENASSGAYRLKAALSVDGGRTFAPEVIVSDVDSIPSTAATGPDWWIGDYTDITADATGARPLWTDARATEGWTCVSPCLWGYVYNISFYTALLVNDSIGASVPVNVSLGGTVGGTGSIALGAAPTPALWLVGASYDVTAPSTTVWNGSTYYFDYWYGARSNPLLYSTGVTLAGTVAGGEHLTACYSAQPSGTCQAPGAPGFLNVSVAPAYANVTVDGVARSITAGGATFPASPGHHWVNATAPGYFPLNRSVTVTPGNTSAVAIVLAPIQGVLAGTVDPTYARVTVNGTNVPVLSNGSFATPLLPGSYDVVASALDYYTFTAVGVPVTASNTTFLSIVLVGLPGWINGTVAPASIAVVTVNDRSTPVDPSTGAFSARVDPGSYWVNATAPGYLPSGSGPLVVGPFGSVSVDLALVQILGSLSGLVIPVSAALTVNGTPVVLSAGTFALDLVPARYIVTASASGYDPLNLSADVRANETTRLVLTLNVSDGWITGHVDPNSAELLIDARPVAVASNGAFNVSASPGTHHLRATSDGYATTDENLTVDAGRATNVAVTLDAIVSASASPAYLLPIALLAVAAVAVVLLVLLWRRRRRPPRG